LLWYDVVSAITAVLKTLPDGNTDFVFTDLLWLVRYRDRAGRSVTNDNNPGCVLTAFGDIHRVLKPDSFCISFYGWNGVDAFFRAWTQAGFRPVGHSTVRKMLTSTSGLATELLCIERMHHSLAG